MADHIYPKVGVLMIIPKGDTVLFQKRGPNARHGANKYSLPGGHTEEHESITEAVVRETLEEVNVTVSCAEFVCAVHDQRASESDWLHMVFVATEWTGEVKNLEPDKCSEVGFYPIDSMPKETQGYIVQAIQAWKGGVRLVELNLKEN